MTAATQTFSESASHQALTGQGHQRPRLFLMPVFKPGVKVRYGGSEETVSHIVVRRREMMVYLIGKEDPVRPERLALQPMSFTIERQPQDLHWYL